MPRLRRAALVMSEREVVHVHGVALVVALILFVILIAALPPGCILHIVEDVVDAEVLVHVVHLAEEVGDFLVVLLLEDRNRGGVGGDGAEPEPGGSDIRGATRRRRRKGLERVVRTARMPAGATRERVARAAMTVVAAARMVNPRLREVMSAMTVLTGGTEAGWRRLGASYLLVGSETIPPWEMRAEL